jgi:hypothetical protein
MASLRWVQVTLPAPTAAFIARGLQEILNNEKLKDEHVYNVLADTRDFFAHVYEHPEAFPPTGTMASSLKMRARRQRGVRRNDGTLKDGTPRNSSPRKRRRATRHQRRIEAHKIRRQNRAEAVAAHNAAIREPEWTDVRSVAGHRSLVESVRDRLFSRGSPGRAEGKNPQLDHKGEPVVRRHRS